MLQRSYVFSDILDFWKNKEAHTCSKTNTSIGDYSDNVRASSDIKSIDYQKENIIINNYSCDVRALPGNYVENDMEAFKEYAVIEKEGGKDLRGNLEDGAKGEIILTEIELFEEKAIGTGKCSEEESKTTTSFNIQEISEEEWEKIGVKICKLYAFHRLEISFERTREAEEKYRRSWRGMFYNFYGKHFCCSSEDHEDSEEEYEYQ